MAQKLHDKLICNEDKADDFIWVNRWEEGKPIYIADSDSGWEKENAFVGIFLGEFANDDGSVPDPMNVEDVMIKLKNLEDRFDKKGKTVFYYGVRSS